MVKWGNLYVYADSPLISKHVFFDILKPYKIVRGYLRRNKDSTDGHFKVIYDKKARKEQRRTWREGYSITVSKARESYTSKENQLEKLKEKITDRNQRSHKENIEKIIYQTLNSNNFIKNPLIIKKKEIENIQSNQEKHENILNEIKETIQKAIPQMKSKRIIQKDLQEFINKSVNYSYLKTYKQHNPYSYQRTHNLQQEISDSLIKHNWEIDTNLRKTINYRNSKYYMETNFNKILQILDSYKLIIRKSFLNIFEILNIINNFHPLRIIQKGNHQAEIWDRKNNILNLFRDCKNERNRIPRNFKIQLKTTEGNKIETIKGTKLTKINQFSFRIASININGLNKIGKIQKLEKIFLQQRITIAIIQETHLRKRLYFENYHSFEKQGYGTTAQGGIAIIIKKCISKYAQEIKHPDKDIIQIKIGELNIIGVYMRHGTQSQMMSQLNDIIEKLGEERYIIAGDFNQTDKEMEKHFRFNTQIIHNTENSAIRNIDHFCVKNQNREILSQTVNINQEENLSDHKMIVTIEKINILSEERKEYYQPTKQQFQDMIIEKLRKQNLSEKSMLNISIIKNVKEKFKKRSIIHINTKNKIGINLTEFNSKNKYNWKQALRKRWRETMRGIEIDNQSKTNYWKEVKRITKARKDTIFNNNEKEKEFKQLIDKIKIPVQESILQEIENKIINTEPDIRSIKQIFPHDKLIKTIQNSRNSSTCDYDKIEMYQNPYIEREHPKYYEFIKSVNRMMREWIRDPNQEVIKYMLSRRMVFIFKQGDPNQISNYRPISINNAFSKNIFEKNT
ncbi:hypothetical protein M0811_14249 [Anaeramoeba ignava]|uniref:Endonuclease/exonuclease/phosphatase domain-containing protein n=1 Tax=Anaeramoeba ignava TaxID=1746090 RepID=A0A9Q0RHN7_ANAIG|nr:hypothetical protein M0811_14249 [Anaeramoeba ignava]